MILQPPDQSVASLTSSLRAISLTILADSIYNFLASVAQLDAPSDWRPGGRGFNPRRGR